MKFKKEKRSSLSGLTEVVFTWLNQAGTDAASFPPFRVIASKEGVKIEGSGPLIESVEGLEEFAKIISDAWTHHREQLKSQILVTKE